MAAATFKPSLPTKPQWGRILRSPRFGLRLLLLVITACAIFFGWLGLELQRARQQEATVKFILAHGANIEFDYDLNGVPPSTGPPPYSYRAPRRNVPHFLRQILGDHFFIHPVSLELYGPVQSGDLDQVSRLSELKWLTIGVSFPTDELPHLQGLPKLTSLRLGDTNISDRDLANLSQLTHLKQLSLGYTRINGSGLVHLRTLRSLTQLDLKETPVDDAGISYLAGLPKLENLDLSASRVTDEGLKRLAEIPSLKKLDLTGTLITDASIPLIQRMRSRVELVLWATEITPRGDIIAGPYSREGAVMNAVSDRRVDRVRWLLEHGADPNRNEDGWTPLHLAAANGDLEIVELLLKYHANTTTRNSRGVTALEAALENRQEKAADSIQQRTNNSATVAGGK